jgi:hypothetical protein
MWATKAFVNNFSAGIKNRDREALRNLNFDVMDNFVGTPVTADL